MIKKRSAREEGPIEVNLTGPEGNAFVLMGYASRWAKQLGKDKEKILADMRSADYEHLLSVLEREFGDYVTFYR